MSAPITIYLAGFVIAFVWTLIRHLPDAQAARSAGIFERSALALVPALISGLIWPAEVILRPLAHGVDWVTTRYEILP